MISQKERPRLSSTSSRVFSNDCEFDSKPSASTSESGVFHFDALQLRMHAHVCAEIVFVVVDGHNGSSSKRACTEAVVSAASPMPSCANNPLCDIDRKATLLGQSAVQVQRVCAILRKRDWRRHITSLCQNEGLRIDCHCLNHFEETRTVICRVTSQATPHADLAPMKKPMREGPRN